MTGTLHDQLAAETAAMEQRVHAAELKAINAANSLYQVERQAKLEVAAQTRARQLDAKTQLEGLIPLLRAAAHAYIALAKDPQFARQRLQSFLSAQLVATTGVIPPMPFGPNANLD